METRGQACRKQGRRGRERGGGAREGEGDGQAARSHRGTAHAPPRARRKTKSPGEQAQIHSLRGFAAVHAARAPAGEGAEVAGNPRGGVHAVGSPSTARGAAGMQGQGLGKGGALISSALTWNRRVEAQNWGLKGRSHSPCSYPAHKPCGLHGGFPFSPNDSLSRGLGRGFFFSLAS
jgi:hypothetical protein